MTKLTLNNLSNLINENVAVVTINNNSAAVVTALENTLSRDGTSPNQMSSSLDMNSNRILNLPTPVAVTDPVRLQDIITLNGTGTITVGAVPNGGTTGQALVKTANADQAVGWGTVVPSTVKFVDTLTLLPSTTVAAAVQTIKVFGYYTVGDCEFLLKRVASQPIYGGTQSADGAWWQYVPGPNGIDARAFGVKADWDNTNTQLSAGGGDSGATDNRVFIQNAMNFALLQSNPGFDSGGGTGSNVLLPKGTMMVSLTLVVPDGVCLKGISPYSTILKMADNFNTSSHFVIVGSPGDSASVASNQTRTGAGTITLNGNNVVSGTSYLLTKRILNVSSSSNNSSLSFTIVGTDGDGQPLSETIAGPNNSTVQTTHYFLTVTSVSSSGTISGTVSVGNSTVASFSSRLENLQLWSGLSNALANTAMVYSNNTQHWGGVKDLKIFAGNRSACRFETGIGGASYFTFEDIECFNYGNGPGVASNNPCIYMNYDGLVTSLRRVVMAGTVTGGAAAVGLKIDGGLVHIIDSHCEQYATAIYDNIRSINSGMINIHSFLGGSGMTQVIKIDPLATATPHLNMSGVFPSGSTNTINDGRTSTITNGNITGWTLI